ncbi:hypothetical protein WJX81_001718 [Elliptochloris bilobata]|uniref:O-methyltransferase domain-containing protein n=1 Tax=Elliptochloris bilobata TaxID=381761 RepID=A0AAW1RNK5_9CHLO
MILGAHVVFLGFPSLYRKQTDAALMRDWRAPPPNPIFAIGIRTFAAFAHIRAALAPPPLTMFELFLGFMRSQVIYTCATLRVADVLAAGPRTAQELAEALGVDADRLYRVLRAAVQIGVFAASGGCRGVGAGTEAQLRTVRFRNNRLSAVLREDHPNCIKDMVCHMMEDNKPAWDALAWGVRSGGDIFAHTHGGQDQWAYFQASARQEHQFSRAMASVEHLGMHSAVTDFNWARYRRLIDVGAAYGSFLAALLRRCPRAKGVLFDQVQVVERARGEWSSKHAALLPRTCFCSGNFFEPGSIPEGRDGDAYVFRLIFHDWDDGSTVRILRAVLQAAGKSAVTLLIVETVITNEFCDSVCSSQQPAFRQASERGFLPHLPRADLAGEAVLRARIAAALPAAARGAAAPGTRTS